MHHTVSKIKNKTKMYAKGNSSVLREDKTHLKFVNGSLKSKERTEPRNLFRRDSRQPVLCRPPREQYTAAVACAVLCCAMWWTIVRYGQLWGPRLRLVVPLPGVSRMLDTLRSVTFAILRIPTCYISKFAYIFCNCSVALV